MWLYVFLLSDIDWSFNVILIRFVSVIVGRVFKFMYGYFINFDIWLWNGWMLCDVFLVNNNYENCFYLILNFIDSIGNKCGRDY